MPNSQITQCMRSAGNTLIAKGVQTYNPQDADRAYGRALEMGATGDMANKIRVNMNQEGMELQSMGHELVWLSQVLPQSAQGNWNDFINTGTQIRQMSIQVMQMSALMLGGELDVFRQLMEQYGPYIEYQTAILVSYATN